MTPTRSGHLPVGGLQLYHEVHGDLTGGAVPLLLIPGAFLATGSMARWVAAFAPARPVVVLDQQGHGRTPDTPRPMSYEQFGDDAAGLLRALGVERADVLGYSQGGGVALQLALRHPDLVGKLVVLAATYHRDGWHPSVRPAIEQLTGDAFAGTPVAAAFREHTPDPVAFEAFVTKVKTLNAVDQELDDEQVRSIRAPTMVVVGDADGVRLEHAVSLFLLRGGEDEQAVETGMISGVPRARLVVLPATSHIAVGEAVGVLEPMITAFLDDVPPPPPSLW
jgi:pimeloyl-ACP methyl ester carboxylesterase